MVKQLRKSNKNSPANRSYNKYDQSIERPSQLKNYQSSIGEDLEMVQSNRTKSLAVSPINTPSIGKSLKMKPKL